MEKRGRPTWALLLPLALGCWGGVPVVNVAPLLEEGRQNQLAAYGKHRGEDQRIAGVIVEAGISHYRRVVGEQAWGQVSAHEELVPYAYVVLVDRQKPGADHVLCVFRDDRVKDPARLRNGTEVVVRGRFASYANDRRGLGLILQSCEIE
jgi:hypothetical protein